MSLTQPNDAMPHKQCIKMDDDAAMLKGCDCIEGHSNKCFTFLISYECTLDASIRLLLL